MSQAVARRWWTRGEYQALPEGPPYYELLDGELIEMTRPIEDHNELGMLLAERWRAHLRSGPGGSLSWEPNLYLPGVEDVCHPDLVYVAPEQRQIRRKDGIHGTPTVVCEILSPSTERLDRRVKMELFRKTAVPHVWLVSPDRPVGVEEYVLGDDGFYRLHASVETPAEWEPSSFPGWRLSLKELDDAMLELDSR
jgi:Uma2 family endonuclease